MPRLWGRELSSDWFESPSDLYLRSDFVFLGFTFAERFLEKSDALTPAASAAVAPRHSGDPRGGGAVRLRAAAGAGVQFLLGQRRAGRRRRRQRRVGPGQYPLEQHARRVE